ncbi:NACHT, LRR and PYD domains-containing protein 3-like [Gambusia affinis]|uniref:NACHT, LRR and PYD domains-containing protein 3-like n=1 Tax=Gambusia affinis TaxID=33528 RepID=UPI001CDD452D|nr:NACHT, LRR and PYD domains-containing protein 3-like [Gambusia affinis]
MEQKAEDEAIKDSRGISSIQAEIHHFQPSFTAQGGSNVVAPSIVGSSVGSININISMGKESNYVFRESLNQDVAGSCNAEQNQNKLAECQQKVKATLRRKFSHLHEGIGTDANKMSLNQIYTELYITEGGCGVVNKEHEVRQIEIASKRCATQDKLIHCSRLFECQPGGERHIKIVVTRGVAGIGKTVSANKFALDWAEEKANTEIDFVFSLSFRELNVMKKTAFSLVELLRVFYPEIKDTEIFNEPESKILFILDGLDESRLSLDFQKSEILSDVTKPSTVSVILTNLIRGCLLPLALIWITTRPVASAQIPVEYIDLVTDVRGFNDSQKEEYFRRKITDKTVANRVIAHVKSCRSLHIMCHLPIFCWMAASVLEKNLANKDSKETPRSLTQMYIHFLSFYVEKMKKKLTRRDSTTDCVRSNLLALGKLAFKELAKGHLIFYESDLILNGIKVTEASMFSGVYTQIFNEEMTVCKERMFCFVHLTIQEFFAALYVYLMFHNENDNVLVKKSSVSRRLMSRESSEVILYKEAVEKALRCENGHFDIFLRFLLGLSLESNQTLLKHLMTNNRTHQRTRTEIIKHIKERIEDSQSLEKCFNLLHCLNELNDHSLVEKVQDIFSSGILNQATLSPADWATLIFVLQTSEEELNVFDLSNYMRSEEGLLRLMPVVKTVQVANLIACNLTAMCCENLASGISSSQLRELNLSNNNLTDAGLKHLSDGLKNSQLETLRLRSCNLTENSSVTIASVISSSCCRLKVLDLTDNDFQDNGVRTFSAGLGSSYCKLEQLRLSGCRVTEEGCTFLASALNSSHLKELDLSYNHPGNSGLLLLSALLEDPQCTLQILSVEQCGESRIQPGPRKYLKKLTLDPNTAHRDLSLSNGNQKATRWTKNSYPDHPDRFDYWTQVLCTEGLTGRCYWETEWVGRVCIGVAYRRMLRKGEGNDRWLGRNDVSWGLNCNRNSYHILHGSMNDVVPATPNSNKVGVYLDWTAGSLSFFRVSCGDRTLLHTFHTTFTEPVYPGFHLGWVDSTVLLC